jgi:hypothetical protein
VPYIRVLGNGLGRIIKIVSLLFGSFRWWSAVIISENIVSGVFVTSPGVLLCWAPLGHHPLSGFSCLVLVCNLWLLRVITLCILELFRDNH